MKSFRALALLLAFSAIVACGDSGTEPIPDPVISGSWSGTFQITSGTTTGDVLFSATFVEAADGSVSGSGSFRVGTAGAIAFSVRNGAHAHPSVSITMGSSGQNDFTYSGVVAPDGSRIDGRLDGSGFNGNTLALVKQ